MNYMCSRKVMTTRLIAGQIKKSLFRMSYYLKPDSQNRKK